MSKIRLNPATIGVVRSWATPQAVKQLIRAMKRTIIPRPTRGGWVRFGSSVTGVREMLAIGPPFISDICFISPVRLAACTRAATDCSCPAEDGLGDRLQGAVQVHRVRRQGDPAARGERALALRRWPGL